jgi:hypothetical protein
MIVYCGYIGGSSGGGTDVGHAIAVDGFGNAYVTGQTNSTQTTFPVTVGPDLTNTGGLDGFVAKVNAAGTALIYCGYIGGDGGTDIGLGVAVDVAGNAYVAGYTSADQTTFPVTVGPDLTFNGGTDAFVAKVNSAGTALVYCGYIGGSGGDTAYGIAVDASGNAYVAGQTFSTEATFPATVGPDLTYAGNGDAFVAKVNVAGTALVYCGYLGGGFGDLAYGIAVDSMGSAYVTGQTSSTETTFPVTGGPDLTSNGGTFDAFVAKLNTAGTALVYCGYIGGNGLEQGNGIAVDGGGNAYVVGQTTSDQTSFPVAVGPDLTYNGGNDVFVAKVNAAGTALVYCGYIGGSGSDIGYAIAVDRFLGIAYVTGATESDQTTFPVIVGPDLTYNSEDAFVAKINAAGTALLYCGYIGGASTDVGLGVAVDVAGNAYVTGGTKSDQATFPVAVGPDLTYNGGFAEFDAFVARITPGRSFFTITPCRVADTRDPNGPYGGPALAANSDRTFVIAAKCGIPLGADAVSFNFIVTQPTALGDMRIVPAGAGLPIVSAINWRPGQTRANNGIVSLGPSGDITAHVDQASGTVHLIIDVNGYFQ